jgi:hypothetical protein
MRHLPCLSTGSLRLVAVVPLLLMFVPVAGAQRPGAMAGGPPGMAMRHDSATMADMSVIHELVMNHDKVTRTVTNLPNGIRTVTESSDPQLARLLKEHVATMNARVEQGRDPGLPIESPALRTLFRNREKITTHADTTTSGVVVVQTSSDAETVAALQTHAAEVSDLVNEGPSALHRAMAASGGDSVPDGMRGMMHGGMMGGGMGGMMMHGGMMHGPGGATGSRSTADSAFTAVQARGADARAMGVDQYSSTHRFDALPDGGRIELQRDVDDSAGVAEIRKHLREIAVAFKRGDFSIPAYVHDQQVPGTVVMAAKRDAITYTERDLPRGGEVRITTSNPEALVAVHEFISFQRHDHRAGGAGATGHAMHDATPRRP